MKNKTTTLSIHDFNVMPNLIFNNNNNGKLYNSCVSTLSPIPKRQVCV